MHDRPRLLVSVRDAAEALAALDGGADLIDVKEPARGPLGRADDATIAEVVQAVGGRVPVSAALGELHVNPDVPPTPLDYVKWGLAGWAGRDWLGTLAEAPQHTVVVAYADYKGAEAPPPGAVVTLALRYRPAAVLFDTFHKDGRTLVDAISLDEIGFLAELCRSVETPVALAGSLGLAEIERLRDVRPTWFAVRGAACEGGREGRIDAEKVRRIKAIL